MRNLLILVFLTICLCGTGCHASMTGKIVDAETGKPIEGAILLVEWIKAQGMVGLTYRTSAKVAEVFSDKSGNVTIPGYFNPFAEGPYITIYKPGFVGWNSHWIFPDSRNRTDFEWKDGYIFKLENFKPSDSHDSHTSFISGAIGSDSIKEKSNIRKAIRWEEELALKERQLKRSK